MTTVGDILCAIRQVKGHLIPDTEFICIPHSALQRTFIDICLDHGRGDPLGQQIDAQITVIAANIRHPTTGADQTGTSQQTIRKG